MYTSITAIRRFALVWIILFFCNVSITNAQEKHYRVTLKIQKDELEDLKGKGLEMDHFYYENETITAEISQSDLDLLRKNNVRFKINIRNLEKRIPKINRRIDKRASKKNILAKVQQRTTPRNFKLGSMGGFHKFDEAITTLDKMHQLYPELITIKSSIGTSIAGESIFMVKISDHAKVDEDEDEMLFTALHHAREPMGLSQMLYYMWYLLENYNSDDEIKTLVDNTELYFVPVINPDGYLHNEKNNPEGGGLWRKNRRSNGNSFGVDLNRNYSYKWGDMYGGSSPNPKSDRYHGKSEFSEPETQSIRDFIEKHEFIATLNYHSFGNLLLHPWGFKADTFTPDQDTFIAMCKYMTKENLYKYGTPSQTVSYTGSGSSDDWMYGEHNTKPKILGMSPEVGAKHDGFWPASSRIIPLCNQAFPLNIKVTRMIARYAKVTPLESDQKITTNYGTVDFSIRRFSLNQSNWRVTLSSTSPFVTSVGKSIRYDKLDLLETDSGTIGFKLNRYTPMGTIIPMTLIVSNGKWEYSKNVNIKYTNDNETKSLATQFGLIASNITDTSLTLSWDMNNDNIAKYNVYQDDKLITSVMDSKVEITGLKANTNYQFSIKAINNSYKIVADSSIISISTTDSLEDDPCDGIPKWNSLHDYLIENKVVFQGNLYEKSINGEWTNLKPCDTKDKSKSILKDTKNDDVIVFPIPAESKLQVLLLNTGIYKYSIVDSARGKTPIFHLL